MSAHGGVFILVSIFALVVNANLLQETISVNKLQNIFQEGIKSNDLTTVYYALKGYKLLNLKIPNVCESIKQIRYNQNNVEQVFYLTNAAAISSCQNYLKPEILQHATQVLDRKDVTLSELYYAVYSLKALGKGTIYDREDALKNLVELLKKDESPVNYGYVFLMCEHMDCGAWTAQQAEAVVLQADETDGRILQWEGGLPVTSLILSSILRTFKKLNKPSPLTDEQRYKFAEYFISRRFVSTSRGAALLLEAANALSDDEPTAISVSIKGKTFLTPDTDSIEISVTDLLGRAIRGLKPEEVVAQSGTRLSDDVVVLSKQPLVQSSKDPTVYVLNLSKLKTQYGMYKIALSVRSKIANVNIAILGEIQVNSVEVGVGDVDGVTSPKAITVTYPNKLQEQVQADHMQKVFLKFTIRDKANKVITVQQAFVRIANPKTSEEIIFIAEPDNTKTYRVDLNVRLISKHFRYESGVYSLNLYLGDKSIANPMDWALGDVNFNFAKDYAVDSPKATINERGPRPLIAHTFRAAEPRPPRIVSDVFACACAAPLLLLIILWIRLRINFSQFPYTISALLFHVALGGSLALYSMLWVQLTMFDTVRYLLPLAALTFLSGNHLLRYLVRSKSSAR